MQFGWGDKAWVLEAKMAFGTVGAKYIRGSQN